MRTPRGLVSAGDQGRLLCGVTLNLKPEERVGLGRKILQEDHSSQINFPGREPAGVSSSSWKLSICLRLRKGARMSEDNLVGPLEQDMGLRLWALPVTPC